MEGGAKGQVGGMEMGEEERRRLAGESRGWRCGGCGARSNEEVLREQDGEAKEGEERRKEEVPEELKFGFRDEMGKEQQQSKDFAVIKDSKPVAAELPSFTAPSISSSSSALPPNPALSASSPPATNTLFSQPLQPQPTPPTQMSTSEAVPGWVDKAIVGLVAGLGVMVIKKLMA